MIHDKWCISNDNVLALHKRREHIKKAAKLGEEIKNIQAMTNQGKIQRENWAVWKRTYPTLGL